MPVARFIRHPSALTLLLLPFLTGCDEIPSNQGIIETHRVALVTATTSPAASASDTWTIYEIHEGRAPRMIRQSTKPLLNATYTSFRGTDGSIAFHDQNGNVTVRHLESGTESDVGTYGPVRYSVDGSLMVYTRWVSPEEPGDEQVFLLNRLSNEELQLSEDECRGKGNEPTDCILGARMPLIGANEAVYMLRRGLDEQGVERDVVLELTPVANEWEFLTVSPVEMELRPRSFHQNVLLVDFTRLEQGLPSSRGFYAIAVATGGVLEVEREMELVSFCHDGSVAGKGGGLLRIVDVTGEPISSTTFPSEYGEVIALECSLTPGD